MSPPPIVLWLPKPPDNANAREHWAVALRKKQAYRASLTDRWRCGYQMPKAPPEPLPRATILAEWFYPDARYHLDPDNAIRRLKPAVDFLVEHGYLAGDTEEHVTWLPVVSHVGVGPPPMSTVRLTLSPLPLQE